MNARAFLLVPLATLLLLLAPACGGDDGDSGGGADFAFGLGAEVVASGGAADNVSAIAFAPDGRIFYAEQHEGTIQIILADGTLQPQPFTQVSVAQWLALDWGLTGLTLDPDFATNHYVYAFYTEPAGGDASAPIGKPVIVRFTEVDGAATERTVLVDDLPLTDTRKPGYNANGDLRFGPDGKLYASLGDYDVFTEEPDLIEGLGTAIGKLLRLNPDGTTPDDNPFVGEQGADPRVFASGFRDPFTFNWGPDGTLYAADNTTVSCEELNVIEPGGFYGWPRMGEFPFDDCAAAPGEQPIYNFAREGTNPGDFLSFVEVSGLARLQDSTYSQLTDGLIVCEGQKSEVNKVVTNGVLRRLTFTDPQTVASSDVIVSECKGDAAVNDGVVYYSTATELKRLTTAEEGQQPVDNGQQTAPPVDNGQQTPPPLEPPSS